MARRGRKPKAVKPKEFLFSNDKSFNKHYTAGTKGNLFSSAAKFMNIFPQGKKEFYMTPVKKGERLGYGKYRIEAHHPNKHSDDRDAYEAKRKNDVIYKNALTKPSRIKYDGITNLAGYHLVTHDRDGKRVEFWLSPYQNGATVMAEMYLPDLERDGTRKKAKTGQDLKKLMSCAVEVGKINASASKKGQLKFTKSKPKGECAKYGNSNAKYGEPLSPKQYEKKAEGQETFLSEDDMIYFYAMTGQDMDLSDYQAIDSVEVDRTSYQPAQNYGAESEAATYSPSQEPDMVNSIQTSPTNENPVLFAEMMRCIHCSNEGKENPMFDYDMGGVSDCLGCGDTMCQEHYESDSHRGCEGFHAEGDAATYSPSSDPDMVNSIATEPTNAEADLFGSQGYNDKMDESMGMRDGTEATMEQSMKDRRDEASAMDKGHSSMGRKYDDVMTMDAEGKNRWVKGKNGKTYVLRKKTGRMVTHNAESWNETDEDTMVTFLNYGLSVSPSERVSDMLEDRDSNYDLPTLEWYLTRSLNGYGDWMSAGYETEDVEEALDMVHGRMGKETKYGYKAESLEDFNGMESVVVEPPLGHGVAQWYAEGNSATYSPSDEPDMVNEIQTEPTNANADLFGSETLAEIEGPTAEATAGGLHSPSSFDISWEDGNGLSSASMPPNEIAWAENKETYCAGCKAAESGCHCAEVYGADNLADYEPIDSIEVDKTSYQPTQDYGSEFEGEFTDDMKKGAAYGMGGYAGFVGFGLIASSAILLLELVGRKMGE